MDRKSKHYQSVVDLVPYRLIFSKVWGSHSHNTNMPGSDTDYLGVYVAPTKQIVSLDKPPQTIDGKSPDVESHEVEKYCHLLIKGNPSMIEMLWTEIMCVASPEWEELRLIRNQFLSCQVVKQYLGYARGQLGRLDAGTRLHTKGGDYNTKWAYHMIRVLGDALQIAKGGEPEVWKEGEEHALLMQIRNGDFRSEEVVSMAKERTAAVEALQPWRLPENGNRAALNKWLLDIRDV